jgi:hypothetical protein
MPFAIPMVCGEQTARNLVARNDVNSLDITRNINHNPGEWRLFTDSSKFKIWSTLQWRRFATLYSWQRSQCEGIL